MLAENVPGEQGELGDSTLSDSTKLSHHKLPGLQVLFKQSTYIQSKQIW